MTELKHFISFYDVLLIYVLIFYWFSKFDINDKSHYSVLILALQLNLFDLNLLVRITDIEVVKLCAMQHLEKLHCVNNLSKGIY